MKYIFILSKEMSALLCRILSGCCDEGPDGEGWKSDELQQLVNKIENQFQAQDGCIERPA